MPLEVVQPPKAPQKQGHERVLVLVKALPHVGQSHGETVCCAGVTLDGQWRRQYPVRFRHLKEGFARWQWIEYDWITPTSKDRRPESRRVQEHTIRPGRTMPERERAQFLAPIILSSTNEAAAQGKTLALIRPRNSRFFWKAKTDKEIDTERRAYETAAKQLSFMDKELAALDPCPYRFSFDWQDSAGKDHRSTCDDWETAAMFRNFDNRHGTRAALAEMEKTFNDRYPARGMAFGMGTHSRRPDQWLLVGVIRLDQVAQATLAL